RAAVIDDVRAVFPDVPRDAGPERLIRHARRLVLAAARDEFAREGVELVDLPEGWGRAELRRADLAGEEAFRGFVEEVIGALDIAPSPLEKDDALELRDGPYSADRYGLSLEASADLASYLLSRAWMLMALELVEELEGEAAAGSPGRRALPADTEPAPRDEQEFFEAQAAAIREEVRARLVRMVRVPVELRAALDRHARLEGDAAADDRAGVGGDPVGRRAGAPGPGPRDTRSVPARTSPRRRRRPSSSHSPRWGAPPSACCAAAPRGPTGPTAGAPRSTAPPARSRTIANHERYPGPDGFRAGPRGRH